MPSWTSAHPTSNTVEPLGYFGLLDKSALASFDLAIPVAVAEVNLGVLTSQYPPRSRVFVPPALPGIDGTGIATYPNGDVYEGNFTAGKRQGQGTMRYATGEVATGTWTDGALKEAAPVPAEGTATPPATTAPADN